MRHPSAPRVIVTERCSPSLMLIALDEEVPLDEEDAETWDDALLPDEALVALAPWPSSAITDVST